MRVNFSPKIKKKRSEPDMNRNECKTNFPSTLTRRMVLSQISSIYDPIGLILPVTLETKLMMRSLVCGEKILEEHKNRKLTRWYDPLTQENVGKWKKKIL